MTADEAFFDEALPHGLALLSTALERRVQRLTIRAGMLAKQVAQTSGPTARGGPANPLLFDENAAGVLEPERQ